MVYFDRDWQRGWNVLVAETGYTDNRLETELQMEDESFEESTIVRR